MPKYESNLSLGSVESIRPEAEGTPGKRTFRLAIKSGNASATLWLEKEQLQQVAAYIHEVAESLSEDSMGSAREAPEEPWSGEAQTFDFKVGQLSMGHDAATQSFLFLVHSTDSPTQGPADLSFWININLAREFSKEAIAVCNAGRPRCFLCSRPIGPEGHMCVRANGHQKFQP
jgi:uncharacterized repeat protein (TIGR03847 family)